MYNELLHSTKHLWKRLKMFESYLMASRYLAGTCWNMHQNRNEMRWEWSEESTHKKQVIEYFIIRKYVHRCNLCEIIFQQKELTSIRYWEFWKMAYIHIPVHQIQQNAWKNDTNVVCYGVLNLSNLMHSQVALM